VAGRDASRASASDLGFAIGPRINAAGRLTDMTVGIECLLAPDFERALELARELDRLNRERRDIEDVMQLDALAGLDAAECERRASLTLFDADWHQGVVGLVASRVRERFHRPTIAFARGTEGELKGSGRSIEGLHLRDTLEIVTRRAPHLIRRFGGHAMAAGLTIAPDDYDAFSAAFESATRASADPALFARTIASDGPLAASELTLGLIKAFDAQIWGQGFPPPLFDNEFKVGKQRLLKDRHLKVSLDLDGHQFDAIWFRRTEPLPDRVRLAYRPVADDYQGMRRIQLLIESAEQ
jgi:single-stranded-DNA-specific exonuclease